MANGKNTYNFIDFCQLCFEFYLPALFLDIRQLLLARLRGLTLNAFKESHDVCMIVVFDFISF